MNVGRRTLEVTYDKNGNKILNQKANNNIKQIDLSNEAPGIYFLLLKTDNGNLNARLIKD